MIVRYQQLLYPYMQTGKYQVDDIGEGQNIDQILYIPYHQILQSNNVT